MNKTELLDLQSKRGAKTASTDTTVKTIEKAVSECRKTIQDRSSEYRNLDSLNKKEAIRQIIIDYVMNCNPLVTGYFDENNRPDTNRLVDRLIEDITDYGFLTPAMLDERVYEIRGNGKEIKVEIEGHVKDLCDMDGNILSFSSPEQQDIIMKKMLGDMRLTPTDALINTSTIEGYRIAAAHSSSTSPDPKNPTADRYNSFVLRKFNKNKMRLGDIVEKHHTLSDNMARLLSLCPAGGLSFVTVGPTASGKTTTNNAILQAVPASTRTILIQNPSEIDLRFRDDTGRIYNDVVHFEAREIKDPTEKDPTVENLMDQTLRFSPTFVVFGELRSDTEFKQAMKIAQAGHPFNTTYHAKNSQGAIDRFLTAYLSECGNMPATLALTNIVSVLDLIIVQKILRDGSRRIIQISEVIGIDPENKEKALLNDLYKYEIDGEPEYDVAGNVKLIHGHHKRVGKISDQLIERFKIEGVSRNRYDYLLNDADDNEEEEYTGKDIEHYGMTIKKSEVS